MSEHGHHKENFFSKYVFSLDHKMISKQFLITGMVMGVIAMVMSALFRIQLANPGESSNILSTFLGRWAEGGVMSPDIYLSLVTIHGTIMVFFVLTGGLSGTFANSGSISSIVSLASWLRLCRIDSSALAIKLLLFLKLIIR